MSFGSRNNNINAGPAELGLTGAGKGDADRSPGWRNHYEDIDWRSQCPVHCDWTKHIDGGHYPRDAGTGECNCDGGFVRRGQKIIKKY
jgi:hypothetical protein